MCPRSGRAPLWTVEETSIRARSQGVSEDFFLDPPTIGLTPWTVLVGLVAPYTVPYDDGTRVSITFSAQET